MLEDHAGVLVLLSQTQDYFLSTGAGLKLTENVGLLQYFCQVD